MRKHNQCHRLGYYLYLKCYYYITPLLSVTERSLAEIIRENQEAYNKFITQNIALNDENAWC